MQGVITYRGMSYFPEQYQAIDKKVSFIFMIRRARKASREDAVTGEERSFPLDTLRALDARFFIHYFIRDSAVLLRVDTLSRSLRANYTLEQYFFYYLLHHVYTPYNNTVIAEERKTSSTLHPSTTSPFYTRPTRCH